MVTYSLALITGNDRISDPLGIGLAQVERVQQYVEVSLYFIDRDQMPERPRQQFAEEKYLIRESGLRDDPDIRMMRPEWEMFFANSRKSSRLQVTMKRFSLAAKAKTSLSLD